jgi:hypothetical protein
MPNRLHLFCPQSISIVGVGSTHSPAPRIEMRLTATVSFARKEMI